MVGAVAIMIRTLFHPSGVLTVTFGAVEALSEAVRACTRLQEKENVLEAFDGGGGESARRTRKKVVGSRRALEGSEGGEEKVSKKQWDEENKEQEEEEVVVDEGTGGGGGGEGIGGRRRDGVGLRQQQRVSLLTAATAALRNLSLDKSNFPKASREKRSVCETLPWSPCFHSSGLSCLHIVASMKFLKVSESIARASG